MNGSVRPTLERLEPSSYVGVDIEDGPGVDQVVDVAGLVETFGEGSFDVVVAAELVEHVRDWRGAFGQMKQVVRPGGTLLVTTRSPGFKVHGYPWDFWRYTDQDMRAIFADFDGVVVEDDELAPGVFVAAVKPAGWAPVDLTAVALHSVVAGRRVADVSGRQVAAFKVRYRAHQAYRAAVPEKVRAPVKRLLAR